MNAKSNTVYAAACALGIILALATGAGAAQDRAADPEPPEIADEATQTDTPAEDSGQQAGSTGDAPPPLEVRQRREFGQTITEYERGGKVFLMTVKPRVGPTQYWNDPDGDGQFQHSTSDNIDENVNLPKWRLGGW